MKVSEQYLHITRDRLNTVAKTIALHTQHISFVAVLGEMGAGKTTLIKAIVKALNSKDEVSSPTFSLVNEYAGDLGKPIYHFDFYRLKSLDEAYDIGYEEYFYGEGICLVEWPQVIESLLPTPRLEVYITKHSPDTRDFVIKSVT
ncbi:MAG: tRNA (adenosine(37)-N6)-threonylcarbamoyltransferase complex ATPase subunit type 1 TsaE [Bacteroidia bacterium]|nr:tRNA (adenosine(37)-N6)-threonylcarbamoyltransferase complex ATPase subunit type 1 TsaE [Bacteroidia bacterium]